MIFLRAPDPLEPLRAAPASPDDPYARLAGLIIFAAVLVIGGLQILGVAAALLFGVLS